jgi:hypothetical protein
LKRNEGDPVLSGHNSPRRQGSFRDMGGRDYKTMETDISTDYFDKNPNDSLTMGR